MDLELKIDSRQADVITKGQLLTIDFDTNLDADDIVTLKITDPNGDILTRNPTDGTLFTDITVKELFRLKIKTDGWDLGHYEFLVETKKEKAHGVDLRSYSESLIVLEPVIQIQAEYISIAETERNTLVVLGLPNHDIIISSSDPEHTIFKGGINDYLGPDTGGPISDTMDKDGKRKYAVIFTETGSYTITVKDIVDNIEDSEDIIVTEKKVSIDVPVRVVIGDDLKIEGVTNAGKYVDIAINDEVVPELNDVVIEADNTFWVTIRTNADYAPNALKTVGPVEIKVYIDRAASGNIQPNEKEDGSVTISMTSQDLTAELSHNEINLGNEFVVSGVASGTKNVDILTIAPKGGSGIGLNGDVSLPNTEITGITYTRTPVFWDYTFSVNISISKYADLGTYFVVVLTPGHDGKYNGIESNSILDITKGKYGDISTKAQDKIVSLLQEATVGAQGSDDLMWVGEIKVGIPTSTITPKYKVVFDETRLFERSEGVFEKQISETEWYGCSYFANTLRDNGFSVSKISDKPITYEKINGFNVLVILSAGEHYSDSEINAIEKFVKEGSRLFLVCDSWRGKATSTNVFTNAIAERFGVSFAKNGWICDDTDHYESEKDYISCPKISNIKSHEITKDIKSFYLVGGTYIKETGSSKVLAYTDKDAWFDDFGDNFGNFIKDKDEKRGRFPVLSEMRYGNGKIVFMSDSSLFTNGWRDKLNNEQVGVNIVKWLAEPISVPPSPWLLIAIVSIIAVIGVGGWYYRYRLKGPLTIERTIYDPCKGDFLEGDLPRMKDWIYRHDPGAYWFAISIQNNTDKPITEWDIALTLSAALKVIDEKIEGVDRKIPHKTDLKSFKISVPEEYGTTIPKGGAQRVYFKLRAEKPKTTYEIGGVFKSKITGDVPIRPKEFKYLCDAGSLRKAILEQPEVASIYERAQFGIRYSPGEVEAIVDAMTIVSDIREMCTSRYPKLAEVKSRVEHLKRYLQNVENKLGQSYNDFEMLVREMDAVLFEKTVPEDYAEKIKRKCLDFRVDLATKLQRQSIERGG